jgi:hypothetical protein
MWISFNLYTMASLVNGNKYPAQSDEVERITKTVIITKTGLRFVRKTGRLQNTQNNKKILSIYASEVNNQNIFGIDAFLTKESLDAVNNVDN